MGSAPAHQAEHSQQMSAATKTAGLCCESGHCGAGCWKAACTWTGQSRINDRFLSHFLFVLHLSGRVYELCKFGNHLGCTSTSESAGGGVSDRSANFRGGCKDGFPVDLLDFLDPCGC